MLVAATVFFAACEPEPVIEPTPTPTPTPSGYENGILTINEGEYTTGVGTVSHYDRTTKTVKDDIFALENNGALVGSVLQSVARHEGKAYLMVNNSNKVWVVDAKTFKIQTKIESIELPRYFQAIDAKKAYISNWKTGVSVVDLTTNTVTKSIKTGVGAERMLKDGSRIWVLNSGGLNKDSTISIIDSGTDGVIKTIKADLGPSSIVSANGSIWVLCTGYSDVPGSKGKLIEYKNDVMVNSYNVPQYASNLVASNDGKTLYFLAENAICIKDATNAKAAPAVFIENANKAKLVYPYGLGIDSKDGTLFCGDAKSFKVKSKVYVFNTATKVAQDSFQTGIGTNSFLFGN